MDATIEGNISCKYSNKSHDLKGNNGEEFVLLSFCITLMVLDNFANVPGLTRTELKPLILLILRGCQLSKSNTCIIFTCIKKNDNLT